MIQAIKRPVYIFSWGLSRVNWEHTNFIASYYIIIHIESIQLKVVMQLYLREWQVLASGYDLLSVVVVCWVEKANRPLQNNSSSGHRNTYISFSHFTYTQQSERPCKQHNSDMDFHHLVETNEFDRTHKYPVYFHFHIPTKLVGNVHKYNCVMERRVESTLDFDIDSMIYFLSFHSNHTSL